MSYLDNPSAIEGTTLFDGNMARKGYGLNKMCFLPQQRRGQSRFFR